MSGEVGIKKDVFDTNVSELTKAVLNIDSSVIGTDDFEKTNIEPFTKDLETIVEAADLLDRYKTMILNDITVLQSVGNDMEENDIDLSNIIEPQTIRV